MFKNSIKYLIRSHIFLALFSFVFLYGLNINYEGALTYSLTICLGIIGVYNSHRLWKYHKGSLPSDIHLWTLNNYRSLLILALSNLVASSILYSIYFSGNRTQNICALICLLISIFYVKKVNKRPLREIPYLKLFVVMAIWYTLFFIFPNMLFGTNQDWGVSFIFLLVILIPSDMKDVHVDHKHMRTIPQVLGLNGSVKFLKIILFFTLAVLFFNGLFLTNEVAWKWGFIYLLILSFMFNQIGYRYFFVFVDFTFLLIGMILIYLN